MFYLFIALLCVFSNAQAQDTRVVRGRIMDATNSLALQGVSVLQKGSTSGTTSDNNGHFQISVSPNSILVFSYVGYETKELPSSSAEMVVSLDPIDNVLEDVVVIGYGSVKRKDVTTAISSVSTKDLDRRPIVNVGQAIQGRAAGVSVIQPNGAPGAEMSIRVRGTTSFNASNDPLYVVDGVPVENIKFLSPNDITDIQILKDASSAAIYGSRAANGVVLITTKSGTVGEAKISLNAQYTANVVNNSFEVLNTQQYRELQEEIGLVNLPLGLTDQTDWFKEAYKVGSLQNYQLSISDGTEKLKYYLSGGYVSDKGILESSFFKRYNFRANIDNNVRDWLKVIANINYSDYNDNGIISGTGSNRGGVVLSVINTPVYAPIWDPIYPERYYNNFYGIGNITSPLENLARGKYNKNRENRLLASGSATVTFLPELKFKSTLTLDRRHGLNTTFLDPISSVWGRSQFGTASDFRNTNSLIVWDNVLTYSKSFDKHSIEAMAGSSWTDSKYSNSYINGSHFRNEIIQTLNAANKIAWNGTGSGGSNWALFSHFARAMYNYDGKYLFTANMRADGSSKLNPNDRWGYFPSFSAAWRLSSEAFLQDVNWINDLKIRGGWGQTGNQSGLGDYSYLQLYNIERFQWFQVGFENAVPNISPANLRTRDLSWETTTQSNIGLDFAGLGNRLSVTLDYYHKKTTDMLMYVSLPEGQIAQTIRRNEGEMTNRGFEVAVNTKNIQNALTWDTDFNISFNRNRLDKLELQKIYYNAKTVDVVNDFVVRNEPGRPLSGFFGYISDGVNPETGELMYRDLNGDSKISSSDRTYIGDPNPKFTYGMTNNFSWNNIDLSIFIQGTYGNDIFNASRMEMEGMYDGKNQITKVLDRWKIPGQITDVPKAGYDMKNSSYFIEDGSYLRLKNISLGYNFHSDRLKRLGINKLQPYFSASNLLTLTRFTGMDPEVNQWGGNGAVQGIDWGTYPHSRSFVFGLNLVF
ncbi:TonB-linked SusC/RagA family outer membrane protein [Sphingobacterium alimentarium]|uniref:TonB-linked SusC/RagA family outer membrane protein n=1 Tax=Sphingobacterium alimentarium TaxID=797292 RepID=A0A4R3VXX1_9SPHI|nr:TonB-linked SusC/RagA family outer membrane protein [Sphingobacterium alimentarium]